MEFFIGLMVFIVLAWVVLKLLALTFHVGIFMLTLPFKILGLVLAVVLTPLILIPLGLFAGLAGLFAGFAGLVMLPFALLGPALPLILLGVGIWILLKRG